MNLETKITIYKFTPQLFTLTRFVASENIGDFLTFWNNTDSNPASFVLPGCFLSMIDPIRVKV